MVCKARVGEESLLVRAPGQVALAVMAVAPLLLAFLLFQRQLMQSFMQASIK